MYCRIQNQYEKNHEVKPEILSSRAFSFVAFAEKSADVQWIMLSRFHSLVHRILQKEREIQY